MKFSQKTNWFMLYEFISLFYPIMWYLNKYHLGKQIIQKTVGIYIMMYLKDIIKKKGIWFT